MRKVPPVAKFRFPVMFGSIILLGSIAYYNRETILNLKDIENERETMYKQNPEDVRLIEQCKAERRRL